MDLCFSVTSPIPRAGNPTAVRREFKETRTRYGGIFRDEKCLTWALREIRERARRYQAIGLLNRERRYTCQPMEAIEEDYVLVWAKVIVLNTIGCQREEKEDA